MPHDTKWNQGFTPAIQSTMAMVYSPCQKFSLSSCEYTHYFWVNFNVNHCNLTQFVKTIALITRVSHPLVTLKRSLVAALWYMKPLRPWRVNLWHLLTMRLVLPLVRKPFFGFFVRIEWRNTLLSDEGGRLASAWCLRKPPRPLGTWQHGDLFLYYKELTISGFWVLKNDIFSWQVTNSVLVKSGLKMNMPSTLSSTLFPLESP